MGNNRGLTLIELILVMAVIGILAAVTISGLNIPAQLGRARDSQRKSDMRAIQSALEIYRADNNAYAAPPACGGAWTVGGSTYMNKVPCDPQGGGSYTYAANGNGYNLTVCLENSSDNDQNTVTVGGSTCTSKKQYKVTNP